MDLRITFANYESRVLTGVPDDASVVLTKEGFLKIAKPGVFSGKSDIATFNNVIAFYNMSMGMTTVEKAAADFIDPSSIPQTPQHKVRFH